MKALIAALTIVMVSYSTAAAQPAPQPQPAAQKVILSKADKDHIRDLLEQAIHKVDCSETPTKDGAPCAKN